jgi:hypothetical protein
MASVELKQGRKEMEREALWIIATIGAGTLFGAFFKMKGGFGPMNLRAVGIVLIGVLSALLAVAKTDHLNAAMGILGAIAGYLFGANVDGNKKESGSSVAADGATLGDHAKLAGRDINETVNNISAKVKELGTLLGQESEKIDRLIASEEEINSPKEYLINSIYEKRFQDQEMAINAVVNRWATEGWQLKGITSDYQGVDGILLLFDRPSKSDSPSVEMYHGLDMSRLSS